MLARLQMRNFRCFRDHTVDFHKTTIIVGKNNAGKSTLIEALRLIALVQNRYRGLTFSAPPAWAELPQRSRGVSPSLSGYEFNRATIFHSYGPPPAEIIAEFNDGRRIELYVGPDAALHGVMFGTDGKLIASKSQTRDLILPRLEILPQVGPVLKEELCLLPDYVKKNLSSGLAPLHFRNQLKLFPEHFAEFKRLAETTWSGLRVQELIGDVEEGEPMGLLLRDGGFVADVGLMGHGLQMWLQVMWFLARTPLDASVVLDEPDVYMHPDLQRRLVRLVKSRFAQTIVATHSIEILSEVDPEEVLVIERSQPRSTFAASLPAVQKVIDHIGGVHNLQLTRFWGAKRVIFVEGEDMALLTKFHSKLFPEEEPIDVLPHLSIGGWGGWQYAVGSSMMLKNSFGEDIAIYCILDSDYRDDAELSQRRFNAKQHGVRLHIWERKEVENYLLVPSAIARLISQLRKTGAPYVSLEIVEAELNRIAEALRDEITDCIANEYFIRNKEKGLQNASRHARQRVAAKWGSVDSKLSILPGKAVLSRITQWAKQTYGVSFSIPRLIAAMRIEEVPEEMSAVLSSISSAIAINYGDT